MAEAGPVLFVVGPTASGKSAVAVEVARRLDGEIVSMDSMQIYRGLPVLTNQPTAEERAMVPHHLLDLVGPEETFDTGRYGRLAKETIADLCERGRVPVFCGGTGLYLRCLVEGLDPVPITDPVIRQRLKEEGEGKPPGWLHERLVALDPEGAARLHPNDCHRILRALEVVGATGRSQASFWNTRREPFVEHFLAFGLEVTRPILYERINQRVDRMWEGGAIDELRRLLADCPLETLGTIRQAIGLRPIAAFLAGEVEKDEARDRMKRQTRRYAKRQMTWFRKEERIRWLPFDCGEERLEAAVEAIVTAYRTELAR